MRFSTAAWGLRRDGSEFIGEMSWGIVETSAGQLLLAVGRDISEQRAAEARLRAVAAMGGRALAGADPADLAGEAIERLTKLLPVTCAEVRLADGSSLASYGHDPDSGTAARDRRPAMSCSSRRRAPSRKRNRASFERSRTRSRPRWRGCATRSACGTRRCTIRSPGWRTARLLHDRLEHALARAERERDATAVLFVDLDNFKQVNDAHGHAAGDAALVELGRRLQTAVRPGDTIARLGGDEFVALCEHVDEESALAVGRRLLEAIGRPFTIGGIEHKLSASIGVALGNSDPDVLLANADAATYRAKAAGRGRIELFRP